MAKQFYVNRETGDTLTEDQMHDLYDTYIFAGIIDDHGYEDFVEGATDEATGLYRRI